MGIRTLLENLRDLLATDTALVAFCNTTFGNPQKVYLGYNRQDPQHDYSPLIIIAEVETVEKRGATIRNKITIGIQVTETSTPVIDTNSVTFPGFINAQELRGKIEETILENQHKVDPAEIDANAFNTPLFPLFTTLTQVTFSSILSSEGY